MLELLKAGSLYGTYYNFSVTVHDTDVSK